MAIYKSDAYVRKHAADPAFDGEHRPGANAPLLPSKVLLGELHAAGFSADRELVSALVLDEPR
jgi:hypothetical protein